MKRAVSSMSSAKDFPGRGPVPGPGGDLGPGGPAPLCLPTSATAPQAAPGRPASRHEAPQPSLRSRAARTRLERGEGGAREEASYLSAHERGPRELVEEGLGLPEEGVLLTYLDRGRERRVRLLFPSRPAAEAWAASRGEEVAILPLGEALAR